MEKAKKKERVGKGGDTRKMGAQGRTDKEDVRRNSISHSRSRRSSRHSRSNCMSQLHLIQFLFSKVLSFCMYVVKDSSFYTHVGVTS